MNQPARSTRPVPRRITATLSMAIVVTLTACGGGDDGDGDAPSGDDTTIAPADTAGADTTDPTDPSGTDGTSDTSDLTDATDTAGATDTTSDGTDLGGPDDFVPGAESFRVVNLLDEPIDVYVRTTGFVTAYGISTGVEPGEVTDYVAPPQDGSLIITTAGAGDPTCVSGCDHFIADIFAWDDTGDTFTVLLHDAEGEPGAYDLWEEPAGNTTSANAMVVADPAVGQFVAIAIDVAEADFGMRMGFANVEGCVDPANLDASILVGGNQTPAFTYEGDTVDALLFDNQDQDCSDDPIGGPFTIEGGPATRTFLFLTGTPGDLDAIVLPFGSDTGGVSTGAGDDGAAAGAAPGPERVESTDDIIAFVADQFVTEFAMPAGDATCLAEFVVDAAPELFVVEDGALLEPPATPETDQLVIDVLTEAASACGIE